MASTHAGFGTVTGPSGSVSFALSDAKNGVTINELYVAERDLRRWPVPNLPGGPSFREPNC
jgi:hypothetical protein